MSFIKWLINQNTPISQYTKLIIDNGVELKTFNQLKNILPYGKDVLESQWQIYNKAWWKKVCKRGDAR